MPPSLPVLVWLVGIMTVLFAHIRIPINPPMPWAVVLLFLFFVVVCFDFIALFGSLVLYDPYL